MAQLILLTAPHLTSGDRRMQALAHFAGIRVELRSLSSWLAEQEADTNGSSPDALRVTLDAATLATLAKTAGFTDLFAHRAMQIFIYHCTADESQQKALRSVTSHHIDAVTAAQSIGGPFQMEPAATPHCGPLANLTFTQPAATLSGFALSAPSDARVFITAEARPLLVQLVSAQTTITLSTVPLPDLDEALDQKNPLHAHALSVIAPLLFLRQSFGDQCWQPSSPTAQVVLDDPPLVRRYGHLDFDKLLESMQRAHYATTLAFIPWNSWRTRRALADRLTAPHSGLTLCMHGCDHTHREFASHDERQLLYKSHTVFRRMHMHEDRTHAEFHMVQVFPQGFFSHEALSALRATSYQAAVNTSIFPVENAQHPLTLGQALLPAVTPAHGFPVFARYHRDEFFDFCFALFLGKPALAVAHHEDFREGYAPWEAFADRLRQQAPALRWPPLIEQLTHCCLRKTVDAQTEEIRFFTRRIRFWRRAKNSSKILLSKQEPDPARIDRVRLDGKLIDYSFSDGLLQVTTFVEDEGPHTLEIFDHDLRSAAVPLTPTSVALKVLLRRALSELRDRVLYRFPRLLAVAQKLVRLAPRPE